MGSALAWTSLLFGAVVTIAPDVGAQPAVQRSRAPEPYRLVFTSSTECRDAREFSAELTRRTNRLRPAAALEPAYTVLVDVAENNAKVRGQLVLRAPDGSITVREVQGSNCHEVLEGLALICAVALDTVAPTDKSLGTSSTREASSGWSLELGARVTALSGVLPNIAPGIAVYLEAGDAGESALSPMLRITGQRTTSTTRVSDSGAREPGSTASADFQLQSLQLALCPLRWAPAQTVRIAPCAFFEAGELRARGSDVVDEEPEFSLFWSAAGAQLAIQAYPLGPLALGAELGVLVPFARDGFYFDPEGPTQPFHRIDPVGIAGGIGAGLRFF
jgi:hypothetical protein